MKRMVQVVSISQITMKRLFNYQRVTENRASAAGKRQWIDMTPQNMRAAEDTRQTAARISAAVAYAGYLFRVQNQMTHYRASYCDGPLHNTLIELLNTLNIPIDLISVDEAMSGATVGGGGPSG
jgi:hypothetical protein